MSQNEFTMAKTFDPKAVEGPTYERWEQSGAFVAQRVPGKEPFTIMMPPPNITGQLHLGHALDGVLAGCVDAISSHEGRSHAVAARHRPCLYCYRGKNCGAPG